MGIKALQRIKAPQAPKKADPVPPKEAPEAELPSKESAAVLEAVPGKLVGSLDAARVRAILLSDLSYFEKIHTMILLVEMDGSDDAFLKMENIREKYNISKTGWYSNLKLLEEKGVFRFTVLHRRGTEVLYCGV